ncbi:MAG: glycosyltransferase family 4 protein [Nanoarchaeota archaeon]
MDKIKILELCHFSEGICGVWNRVKEESTRLADKGYEVSVFSSNAIKGSNEVASANEIIGNFKIKRFPYIKLGGESFSFWNFTKEALDYSPDIIIAHVYRQIHTTKALEIKKELKRLGKKCVVFLVTHAPFNQDNSERGILASLSVKFYDKFIGKRIINKFDRVITISNWEVSHLKKIGVQNKRLFYIPNGVPEIFFRSESKQGDDNKILFLGRVSPVKNLEIVISVLNKVDKQYYFEIVGPIEGNYKEKLQYLAKKQGVEKRIIFSKKIYDIKEKIRKLDSSLFFILSSKREGMPQSLIEAMARGRICIGSDVDGIKDLIKNKINGFTFEKGNIVSLADLLNNINKLDYKKLRSISKQSVIFASKFKLDMIANKLNNLIKEELSK